MNIAVYCVSHIPTRLPNKIQLTTVARQSRPVEKWTVNGDFVEFQPTDLMFSNLNWLEVISIIREFGPVFGRWNDRGESLELRIRELARQAFALAARLTKEDVRAIILGTTSSHHEDSLVVEVASRIRGIPQYFLVPIAPSYRLIPMRQKDGMLDRTAPLFLLNDVNPAPEMIRQIQSSMGDARLNFAGRIQYSYGKTVRTVSQHALRRTLKRHLSLDSVSNVRWTTDLQLLRRHKDALCELDYFVSEDIHISRNGSQDSVIIWGSFQPEATSFPEGGKWGNFEDIVAELRFRLPHIKIWYREHPMIAMFGENGYCTRVGTYRSPEFYSRLRSLGVIFLPWRTALGSSEPKNTNSLTIGGSISLERSIKGESTIITGKPWFSGIPGTCDFEQFLSDPSGIDINPNQDIAVQAESFLMRMLMGTTIANAQIIGGITPSKQVDRSRESAQSDLLNLLRAIKDFESQKGDLPSCH